MDIDTEETMNLTKWIDERTDAERAAILTHIVKGLVGLKQPILVPTVSG